MFTVAACNGRGPGGGGDESKTVTLVYESDKNAYWQQIKSEFETKYAEEGYTIELVPVGGGQVEGKQTNMIAQNNPPDLILGGDVHIQSQSRYLMPLNDLIE